MGRFRAAVAFPLVATFLAGCLDQTDVGDGVPPVPEVPLDWALRALPFGEGHLHNVSDQHRGLSTPNFELLGWTPLSRSGATMGGGGCGDVSPDAARKLAVLTTNWGDEAGLAVVDVTDPADPQMTGEIVSTAFWFRDAEITPDARWAVVASFPANPVSAPIGVPVSPRFTQGECGAAAAPPALMSQFGGIGLVDLSDPSKPAIIDFAPDYRTGPHSVYATRIDGTYYAIATILDASHALARFYFYTIENARLEPYGVYTGQLAADPAQTPLSNFHNDAWIHKHPITGDLLGYLANWNGGLVIVRLDGDGQVVPIGGWTDYDAAKGSEMTGQIHSVALPAGLWDGKHYTFIGQEIIARPANRPTGQVIMLDTTNPAAPTPVARWTLPVDAGTWDTTHMWCCLFSTHYIGLVGQTLFVSLYHGGVWAVDARPGSGPELPTLGVFVPTPPTGGFEGADPMGLAPMVMEVLPLDTGDLVSFDEHGGLYTYRFDASVPVPSPEPWIKDAWLS